MSKISPAQAQKLAKGFYGHDLAPAQAEIMALVLDMSLPRVAILGATQIQKSRAAARAIGILATLGHQITIVGPKADQAIMPLYYFINMMGFNPYFQSLMLQGGEDKIEKLQSAETKNFMVFRGNGSIRAVTLNERDSQDKKKNALGKGSEIVLFEEASLTSNETESMVFRMIGGYGKKGRIIKLGNAISREPMQDHFYRAVQGEDGYVSLTVDYHRAVAEGIYTQEFVDEARKKPFFDQLYACKFPDPSGLVKGGYQKLFKTEDLIAAYTDKADTNGHCIVGIDIGQGKPDKTSIIARWPKYAAKVFETGNEDLMAQIGEYVDLVKRLKPVKVNVDATGMGAAVAARLDELDLPVNASIVGGSSETEGYANLKAEGYFKARDWLVNEGGKLGTGNWNELLEVAYKTRSDKNTIIESKQELLARGVPSYNDADALMLTFADNREILDEADFGFV